jgi:DHA2 family multidrug resistance protein
MIQSMTGAAPTPQALQRAYGALFGMVQQQAVMMSFNDVFFMLMVAFVCMFPLIFIMRKPKHHGGAAMAAH